ncbi:MAG TPA: SAM-dependent methyltransferase [Trebonia sp.]|jgi:hypothetical protein|nr:SAM-dependent methyltransferase [Trebonia sp.]
MDAATVPAVPVLDAGGIARLRDVLAGGYLADEADRKLAGSLLARWPGTAALVTDANEFHRRAATWAVAEGAAGVVFAAAGYPLEGGFHEAAAAQQPKALFAYAEAAQIPSMYNQALLGARDPLRVCARLGSARDPAGLLSMPAVQAILDRGPVMVQLQLCCHWWPGEFCEWALGEYRRLLRKRAPGSTLALSVVIPGAADGAGEFMASMSRAGGTVYSHTESDVAGWIAAAGLGLAPPDVMDVRGRGLDWAAAEFSRQRTVARAIEAIAVVP